MAQVKRWKQPFHQARWQIARLWYRHFSNLTTIAITGSYGKTSTSRAVAVVLSQKYQTLMTDINLDTVYNLPITLLKLRSFHQKLVLELGVDHRGEMNSYLELVKPSVGVLTGITPVHSEPELLGSLSGIIEEKGTLLEKLPNNGVAILNRDDPQVVKMAQKSKAQVIWYGLGKKSDFWADDIRVDTKGTSFTVHCDTAPYRSKPVRVKTGLIGRHFVQVCLVAVAIGRREGISWPLIKTGLAKIKPLQGRVNLEKGPLGSTLINDSLRANPVSTIAGLQLLKDLPTKGKRIAVLGEMGELGSSAKESHQKVGQKVAELKIDYLVCVGPLQKHAAESALKLGMKQSQVFWVKDVFAATEALRKVLKKDDLFYLKGSLLRHMERVLLILNNDKVGCRVTSCHYYHQCPSCPYLKSGLE
ncbi:UDP-N-acetylmuramoyl-tripeptide--D-alanyl-D-alanine ligase [Patescibacteria group bacterium]